MHLLDAVHASILSERDGLSISTTEHFDNVDYSSDVKTLSHEKNMHVPSATNSSDASTPDSTTTAPEKPIHKAFSCVLCSQRKVKCDKAPGGCANCTKARVECIYKAPPPPRRRKKGVREVDVQTRLRLYERALIEQGIDPEELVRKGLETPAAKEDNVLGMNKYDDEVRAEKEISKRRETNNVGILVKDGGKSRYLENTLWTSLQSEFRDPKRLLSDSSDEEDEEAANMERLTPAPVVTSGVDELLGDALLGSSDAPSSLRSFHPSPGQIFKLWQVYLDNINPLIKVFHAPSVQQIISNASGNLEEIPKSVECLMFGIYCTAVESLGNIDCISIMGEPKEVVSKRFKMAAHFALNRASFLKTSDIMVLQAFVLFITSLVNFDARVVWILTGVAARIGQRIGLHRDPETLSLPPFEGEMRRRLWYQILMQDGFAEKLAGVGGSLFFGQVKRPLNLNDSDLFPDMTELPKEHEGATEMMFFLIRCHLGEFLRHSTNSKSSFDGVWNKLSGTAASLAVKDRAIDELEALYQRKFLDYCDKSIPWHFMCTSLAKGVVGMLRFISHCPDGTDVNLPQSEKDLLFNWAVSVVRWQNKAYTTKEMAGCLWHINSHFQWKAFVYFVSALKHRTDAAEVDAAWKEVQTVFDFHPNFATQARRQALPIAVATLTLTSWDAYVAWRGVPQGGEPYFIQVLRARKGKRKGKLGAGQRSVGTTQSSSVIDAVQEVATFAQPQLPISTPPPTDLVDSFQWDPDTVDALDGTYLNDLDMPMDDGQFNWSNWDNVMLSFELQKANGFAAEGTGYGGSWSVYGNQDGSC